LQVVSLAAGETVPDCIAQYQDSGLVEFAEPDYERHLDLTPNDPRYADGSLWGLYNFGQSGGTPHADIDAAGGWDTATSASNIVVAVLDSGIRYTHEDLAANMWVNPRDGGHGWNALTGTNTPLDDQGHGTMMAGVLGAVGNDGKGMVGVAWRVQIMACKCFNNANPPVGYDSDIVTCIDYARTNGAQIINASLGGNGNSQSLSNAIYAARAAGIIVVAAAGDNPRNIDVTPYYPACYGLDNIVSVAYTTRADALGRYSGYGATNVALAAPGAAMYSTFFVNDSSYLGSTALEGTSYAVAYVSGALALMLNVYPHDTYSQILARLLNSTDPVPALAGKCVTGGRLNLRHALNPPIRLLALPGQPSGSRLRVACDTNRTCIIQASTNLAAWVSVYTNTTSSDGTFEFVDSAAANFTQRFYRALGLRTSAMAPVRLLVLPRATNTLAQLRVAADANRYCVIQTSSNLTAWTPVFTNATTLAGSFDFTDPGATNLDRRFYRVQAAP